MYRISIEEFELKCLEANGDQDEDATMHYVDDDGSNTDESEVDEDLSDTDSIFGSLVGSQSGQQADLGDVEEEGESDDVEGEDGSVVGEDVGEVEEEEETLARTETATSRSCDTRVDATLSDDELDKDLANDINKICISSVRDKVDIYKEQAMAGLPISSETEMIVKKALSKHANPVPCNICGELMKNDRGVKLHIAKMHNK